jgi:glycine betaine/proline transport system ATP-binding protein
MTKAEPDRPVKLSCRSLWKVYGAPAERLVQKRDFFSGDPRAVGERLKQGGQIPAVIDASFDVHVG